MKKRNPALSAKRIVRRVRDMTASAFDSGITMKVAAWVRRKFSSLSLRCAGTFLLTFGIYSAAIAIVKMFMWETDPIQDVTVSALCALAALPLLFSKLTLGESLVKTGSGRTLLSFLGIREEAVKWDVPFGRSNISFIFGVGVGTLTFFAGAGELLMALALVLLGGVVLTVPEAAVMFAAVFIPLGMSLPCTVLSVLGTVSFLIKYLRYKRCAVGYPHDKAAGVMLLSVVLGVLISVYGGGSASYIALLFVYFIISFSPSGRVLGGKLMATLVASGGLAAAVFEAFAIMSYAATRGGQTMASAVSELSVCDTEVMSLTACALVPVAVYILISGGALSRLTALLCGASMTAFLVICEDYVYLAGAVIGAVAALTFCNRRLGYFTVALGIFSTVVWVWLGGSWNAIPRLMKHVLIRPEGTDASYEYFMFGEGLSGGFGHGGSFYMAVMSRLGFVGIAVLLAFGILLVSEIISLQKKSAMASNTVYKNACIPFCGLISLLVCGLSVNIWESPEVFLLFWMLCGASGACIAGGNRRADKLLEAEREEKSRNSAGIVLILDGSKERSNQNGK